MAKKKSSYFCKECGYESSGWLGKCPSCGAWNSFVEEPQAALPPRGRGSWVAPETSGAAPRPQPLAELPAAGRELRRTTGIEELDRVLGGGFVEGSLVLLGGDPGIGKSTLLLQASAALGQHKLPVLYVSGEESPQQIKLRAERLGLGGAAIQVLAATSLTQIQEAISSSGARFAVIDSIQTIYVPELESAPGSVSQVREATGGLLRLAKSLNVTIVLVGHVTKEGAIAGPRVLEHMVDTVLYFEGDEVGRFRILRCVKNRFGNTDEIGVFEMAEKGLVSVASPSLALLSGRPLQTPGTAVTASLEGSRPLLLEIQALANVTHYPQAVRMAQGLDRLRLTLLLAVMEKQLHRDMSAVDVYLNVAGGLRIRETAADLAVVAAILSSLEEKEIADDLLILGELGLSGELRGMSAPERRVLEAARLGWRRFLLPAQTERRVRELELPAACTIYYVGQLGEAVDLLFPA